jgi:hypothetical protein
MLNSVTLTVAGHLSLGYLLGDLGSLYFFLICPFFFANKDSRIIPRVYLSSPYSNMPHQFGVGNILTLTIPFFSCVCV